MTLEPVSKEQAARAFYACVGLDPQGRATPEGAAAQGECYTLAGEAGTVWLSIAFGSEAWIFAAAGTGQGMTAPGLEAIEAEAHRRGCALVGFQTMRRGLVRRARAVGYVQEKQIGKGWIMKKAIK